VDDLTPFAVKNGRDALADTPGMANQMLSVGSTLYERAMLYGLGKSNPFATVPWLDVPDRGHVPWPRSAVEHVAAHAPPDLARMVRLGMPPASVRATCASGPRTPRQRARQAWHLVQAAEDAAAPEDRLHPAGGGRRA
jgi:hypothetical protein